MADQVSFKDIKNWGVEIEKKITSSWKSSEMFKFNPKTKKKIYSIDTPPPYINSPIHMGHATTYCYMDFFARYKRMKGFEVLFPLGLDRNGLPIEMGAEKKFNVSAFKMSRDKFIDYCERLLKETSAESIDSFSKLGISFSSYKEGKEIGSVYLTDSPEYRKLTQATFIDLYKRGLIYEDSRINNWDPKLMTTIADSEIDYEEIESLFVDVKWKVKETGEEIIIATTRPELICTCGMVIFNPHDKRYKNLNGKHAISPIFEREIVIKSHPLAQIEKGSGLVMMCSAGDLSDIQFFREQNLKSVIAINADGTMNKNAGFLQGLKVKEAREKMLSELRKKKLIVKESKISHRTPISERSGAEVEFIEMPEYYLKQLEFKEELRKIAFKVNFYPAESKKILDNWIDSVTIDWPISRRRFYATPIPLWYSDSGLIALPQEGEYYQPWKEKIKENADVFKNGKIIGKVKDFKDEKWKGEERVFDTWFDSSISELFIIHYKTNNEFFKKAYPVTLRPQGKEIVRTWLYYTLLRGYLETKKPCFVDAWIHQHILDEKGSKMSKSLGNVVDPQEILRDFGGEALRLWAVEEGDLAKQDLNCSKEKIKSQLKTINKIINVARFVFQFSKPQKVKLTKFDELFIDYIEDLISFCDGHYDKYDFNKPALKLRYFLWEVFASHYIEMIKERAYNQDKKFSKDESESAKYTLYFLLERYLRLMYPIIPQLSCVIAKEMKIDLHKEEFPELKEKQKEKKKKSEKTEKSKAALVDKIIEFNKQVWKAKKDAGISLRESIKGIKIPSELKDFEKDLISCHKLLN